jgi:hypothetical protein
LITILNLLLINYLPININTFFILATWQNTFLTFPVGLKQYIIHALQFTLNSEL